MAQTNRTCSEEPTLTQLAERMLDYARKIESAIPSPTFQHDTIGGLPSELADVRLEAIATSEKFNDLVRGSRGAEARWWKNGINPPCNHMAWSFIWRFKIPQNVPIEGMISYAELASKCGVDEENLSAVIRYAATTLRCFYEPKPGYVAHTADTRLLVELPNMNDVVGFCTEQLFPGSTGYANAVAKWHGSQELSHSAYSEHFQTDKSFFHHLVEIPDWQRRFGSAMQEFSLGDAEATGNTALAYPWHEIADGKGVMVDVGGGTGHISSLISTHHPEMTFFVEDLPHLISSLPPSPSPRLTFLPHNYFHPQPQPGLGADFYFFGMIFHNLPDPSVLLVLRALIPALRPGARILWCDRDILPLGEGLEQRRTTTLAVDMLMRLLLNAKERTLEEKKALFERADPRFKYARNIKGGNGSFTVTEAVWTP